MLERIGKLLLLQNIFVNLGSSLANRQLSTGLLYLLIKITELSILNIWQSFLILYVP